MGASKHTGGVQTYGGIQRYRGPPKHMRHPNVWGIWTPLSVTKHAFFVACMYRGNPNIIQTCRGCPNILWASKHMGGVQTYRRVSKHIGTSKHMGVSTHIRDPNIQGGIQTCRGCVQTYEVHPNIHEASKIWGHPNVWADIDTPLV